MDEPIIRPYVPPGMEAMTNEALCELAQRGDEDAANVLIWRNEMFLVQIAGELYKKLFSRSHDYSVALEDLLQIARLAFWKAIETFDSSHGAKLTTYARIVVGNKILDYKEQYVEETDFEQKLISRDMRKNENEKDEPDEETIIDVKANGNKFIRWPEVVLIREETKEEIDRSISSLPPREKTYLCYRFGYPDGDERNMKDTAEHFSLRVSRAEKIEIAALAAFRKGLSWCDDVSEADRFQSDSEFCENRALSGSAISF